MPIHEKSGEGHLLCMSMASKKEKKNCFIASGYGAMDVPKEKFIIFYGILCFFCVAVFVVRRTD